jgi:hypothetical protein
MTPSAFAHLLSKMRAAPNAHEYAISAAAACFTLYVEFQPEM